MNTFSFLWSCFFFSVLEPALLTKIATQHQELKGRLQYADRFFTKPTTKVLSVIPGNDPVLESYARWQPYELVRNSKKSESSNFFFFPFVSNFLNEMRIEFCTFPTKNLVLPQSNFDEETSPKKTLVSNQL